VRKGPCEEPAFPKERLEEHSDPFGDRLARGRAGTRRSRQFDSERFCARGEDPADRPLAALLPHDVDEARLREAVDVVVGGLLVHPEPLRHGTGVVRFAGEFTQDLPSLRMAEGGKLLGPV